MRVLLDENIDRLLKPLFDTAFEVVTVQEQGWSSMQNGELLRTAEKSSTCSLPWIATFPISRI